MFDVTGIQMEALIHPMRAEGHPVFLWHLDTRGCDVTGFPLAQWIISQAYTDTQQVMFEKTGCHIDLHGGSLLSRDSNTNTQLYPVNFNWKEQSKCLRVGFAWFQRAQDKQKSAVALLDSYSRETDPMLLLQQQKVEIISGSICGHQPSQLRLALPFAFPRNPGRQKVLSTYPRMAEALFHPYGVTQNSCTHTPKD